MCAGYRGASLMKTKREHKSRAGEQCVREEGHARECRAANHVTRCHPKGKEGRRRAVLSQYNTEEGEEGEDGQCRGGGGREKPET